MSDEEILHKIKAVLIDTLRTGEKEITPSTRFVEDLGADSVDRMALLMALEDAFAFSIDDTTAAGLASVGDVLAFVKQVSAK